MRYVLRTVLLLAVFVGAGFFTYEAVVHYAVNAGRAESQVRLAGAMAGMFVGGAAAVVMGIGLAMRKRG